MEPNQTSAPTLATRPDLRLVVVNGEKHVRRQGRGHSMEDTQMGENDVNDLSACLSAVGLRQDREAFQILFDYFAPRVKAYVMKLGCTPPQAEDLTQDVMIKVWRKAGQFDPVKAAPSTWIFRIARNQRIDIFRRENRPELDADDPGLVPEPDRPSDVVLEQRQSEEQLREALEKLPETQRVLLHLSFFQDMPHGRIAKHMNLPLGTVKSRLRLALAKLRICLADGGTSLIDGSDL